MQRMIQWTYLIYAARRICPFYRLDILIPYQLRHKKKLFHLHLFDPGELKILKRNWFTLCSVWFSVLLLVCKNLSLCIVHACVGCVFGVRMCVVCVSETPGYLMKTELRGAQILIYYYSCVERLNNASLWQVLKSSSMVVHMYTIFRLFYSSSCVFESEWASP